VRGRILGRSGGDKCDRVLKNASKATGVLHLIRLIRVFRGADVLEFARGANNGDSRLHKIDEAEIATSIIRGEFKTQKLEHNSKNRRLSSVIATFECGPLEQTPIHRVGQVHYHDLPKSL